MISKIKYVKIFGGKKQILRTELMERNRTSTKEPSRFIWSPKMNTELPIDDIFILP